MEVYGMLKRFEVSNYRTFGKKITVDFSNVGGYQFNQDCVTNNVLSKIIIYGRNATGKTNLGNALLDIIDIIFPENESMFQNSNFLNADSEERYAEFLYVFQFNNVEVEYCYKKLSNEQLLEETLKIDGHTLFEMNFEEQVGTFFYLDTINVESVLLERYLESLSWSKNEEQNRIHFNSIPLLRWLINNTLLQEDSILLQLNDYVKCMRMIQVGRYVGRSSEYLNNSFFDMLDRDNNLQDFEEFLNVMGVDCELVMHTLPDGKKELYFVHNNLVPFYPTASSGTKALMDLYRRLHFAKEASLLYIDEYDAFYHYEMSENVLKYFKYRYPSCQLILTTHNTNLMTNKLMRPDGLFILSRDGRLTALCDATERELREGHNLEKLYISGEFNKFE